MSKTDLLERYHNYAREKICPTGILEPEDYWEFDDPPEQFPEDQSQVQDHEDEEYQEELDLGVGREKMERTVKWQHGKVIPSNRS